ncbi:unnamed protein product [Cladocopium goreaui]|uniref:Gypsy retrotransposon integrase-like protein 1 n=1 Tax=Cladocopium goreaui TaxID=2562237 RepID=A0A9P1C914_9DINO|nr:unnamed protein product [Cladocopium goreaui]
MFWIASEGRSLPEEMRGPRLMQQLRERAGKIVQHLTVEEVSSSRGIEIIKNVMEKSPIIKLLDQKKIDQRRQKFMKLSRLPQESLESFINRVEIYRRENQSSPAYQVGSQFYVGHLMDAAKLTKRDQALIKAACGGTLEDENLVTNAIIDLADQLEGIHGCPIGRGEPTLDHEDKYLVQKAGVRRKKRFFGRRRFRDTLMAILEDDENLEEDGDEDAILEGMGEESMDEDEEDMTFFGGKIFAQEYKARNRVREIKKMRQYFQKEANGGGGNTRDREQVRKWVKEQQKTEPCFICRQLGHWSQEYPYRNKAPVHASNVTFPVAMAQSESDWAYLKACVQSDAQYKGSMRPQPGHFPSCQFMVETPNEIHDICWSLTELGDKMILDLGCMKTVAGTAWVNPVVKRWKEEGHFVKVVPESESFRFGDGHVNQSRFAIILHVSIATIPCLLRISVVAGSCPPLLSKPVCSALGLVVDTASHTISSRKHHVKAFGLYQSRGGHYTIKIDDIEHLQEVPQHAMLESYREVMPLQISSGSRRVMFASPDDPSDSVDRIPSNVPGSDGGSMGDGRPNDLIGRDAGSGGGGCQQTLNNQEGSTNDQVEEADNFTGYQNTSGSSTGQHQPAACTDARDASADATDVHADAAPCNSACRGGDAQGAQEVESQVGFPTQDSQAGRSDTSAGGLSDTFQRLLTRPDLQRDALTVDPDIDVQMEVVTSDVAHQGGRGVRGQETLEAQSTLDPTHARAPSGVDVGSHRFGKTAVLQPQGLSVGIGTDARGGGGGTRRTSPPKQECLQEMISDPNAPTVREQERRTQDRIDLVCAGDPSDGARHRGVEDVPQHDSGKDVLHSEERNNPGKHKITLNRRQKRSIQIGVQKALRTHARIYDVIKMKYKRWSLMEIFAGRATLSEMAHETGRWDVLPPQDVLYGLDLTSEEHQQMLKDVIDAQKPEVITLSPPCGPWSSWQRMRKRKDILSALRREHLPFWEFVLWVWSYQTTNGRLVVLEQPAQSDALKMPLMSRRNPVHQQVVHMCRMGLVDQVSGKPHKKPTAIQMNHPCITSTAFPPMECNHQPGEHEPIEGSVRIQDPNGTDKWISIRRSTLASRWSEEFCNWLLTGLESALEESAQQIVVPLHAKVPPNRIWETVPAEVEPTPEGQLRQHMRMVDNGTRYEDINFAGGAALLHRTIRSTLAHLHVSLGHISNEKLQRMLQLNGAQKEIIEAVKQLQCQIWAQVVPPMAIPKAAFQRPMAFNERIVADTFYVWDANNDKYAVTHVLDSFSLYQIAYLLVTFAVFHDVVPPSAHWRMALAERHGAVLKVLLMKVIKETTVVGLEDLKQAVVSVTASRNRQARVSGFSPIQLVFGKECGAPNNLMDTLAGHMKFQLSQPSTVDESFQRASQIRKAATEAFQWMEANEVLRRAAGSRSRLPKLELITEGAQVMFYEPPANRRGLARRMQDNISWVGPAVVVAVERKDGAVKRVWLRYQNKLKGMPLEFIRLAVVEEQEAANIAREALEELEKQLESGREQTAPVSQETLQKSTSNLDDVPISIHKKEVPMVDPGFHRPFLHPSSRQQKKPRTEGSHRDPAFGTFSERRAVFDEAMSKTEKHLKLMKEKLQPKSTDIVLPGSQSVFSVAIPNPDPPYIDVWKFYNPEYSDSDESFAEALAVSIDNNVLAALHAVPTTALQTPAFDMPSDFEEDDVMAVERSALHRDNRMVYPQGLDVTMQPVPATPQTRLKLPPNLEPMFRNVPPRMKRPLTREESSPILKMQGRKPTPTMDYWVLSIEDGELCRVHVQPRLHMFDVLEFHRDTPESEMPESNLKLPGGITKEWITGVRATQIYYLHNPLRWGQARQINASTNQTEDPFGRRTPGQMMNEFVLDNLNWRGQGIRPRWNTQQDLQRLWQGITRFQIRDPEDPPATLQTWMRGRYFAEEMWRDGQHAVEAFVSLRDAAGWPNDSLLRHRLGPLEMPESTHHGLRELIETPEEKHVEDVLKPETGKVRLELRWNDLSEAWQKAFEKPILEALEVYFKHDALSPVMEDEVIAHEELLPSRFVLVNKNDPRNTHPSDEAIADAVLKARLVIAGHRDQRAGDFETESPTASLLAHNVLCFLAAQWKWIMAFSDISAAFLQGDYLPAERRVFIQTPKNYPMELQLCPGLFSFFGHGTELQALLAVHVDDVRLVASPEHAEEMRRRLDSLFSFGEWKHPEEWTKFCGRCEKQLSDGTVLIQMDKYAERLLDPPQRASPQQKHPLQPNEKRWIGTIAGQLNWMARQCRADLSFGVSRVQQLAGVNDPAALSELKILLERARQPVTIRYEALGCEVKNMIVLAISDASFAGMPRGRSQGGLAIAFANPEILHGQAKMAIVAHHSGLLKRVVRSSLAAEISQAASTMEEADFVRALLAEAIRPDFRLNSWLPTAAQWKLVLVMDSRTGYDLLNGTALGEDKRLAIDIAAMKQALAEDGGSRLVRWVPGEELLSDNLTKLVGNQKLMRAMATALWALKDTEVAKKIRADAAARKRTYRQRVAADRTQAESVRSR